ncbi:Glycosyl hydrolase catalytic core domain-containing protein 6 [Elsinoe fawcettii]|nr:Glycosyl hydrolase catalytic core domain-containing protein 6 [Elsinoe fawcettii]
MIPFNNRLGFQHLLPVLLFFSTTNAQNTTSNKRGIAFIGDSNPSDNRLLSSNPSPLKWYYNWSPYPVSLLSTLEFLPMIHGLDATRDPRTEQVISRLPASSTHLLSFNEPDGTTSSGGSSISPQDAARAYRDYVLPFRTGQRAGGRKWKISWPATTGSGNGLEWLRAFNESCYELSPEGCPADFIAAHWYGGFEGLASWLGTLDEFYNANGTGDGRKGIWVTEMALPQMSAEMTRAMMNQTLPYLDGLEYVERYAWFGAFRADEANEWTGDGVALFDDNGGLTGLGATYLGDGFEVGQKGQGGGVEEGAARRQGMSVLALVAACLMSMIMIVW